MEKKIKFSLIGQKPPYDKNGKTNFPSTWAKKGVYIIYENNIVVYVGSSRYNLYKTMYRHFESWHNIIQKVVTYKNRQKKYKVEVFECGFKDVLTLETRFILKYKPRDNKNKLERVKSKKTEKKGDTFIKEIKAPF